MKEIWLYEEHYSRYVILLHAYTGTPADVSGLARFLHRHHYNVFVPVFRGHENHQVQEILAASPRDWWEDAQHAVEKLRSQGVTTIATLGLSMGGIMATGLAVEQQVEIAGTFCSPVSCNNAQLPGLMDSFMTFAKHSVGEDEERLTEIRNQAMEQMLAIQEYSSRFAENLSEVTGPFYIAQAGKDRLIDPEVSLDMKDALVNAAVDFHWFEESGHVITVDRSRMAFQESVLEFLNQQEWR